MSLLLMIMFFREVTQHQFFWDDWRTRCTAWSWRWKKSRSFETSVSLSIVTVYTTLNTLTYKENVQFLQCVHRGCRVTKIYLTQENMLYRGAAKSLARPTSRCRPILFDASLVALVYINSTNTPSIMIISRIYEYPAHGRQRNILHEIRKRKANWMVISYVETAF